jgi:hypothetical protein
MRIAWIPIEFARESTPVTLTVLTEEASAEGAPLERATRRVDVRGLVVLGAALLVGLPGVLLVSRLFATIALSLVLGH